MDTFAVSITLSLSAEKAGIAKTSKLRMALIPALYFGFFQALMPLIGYAGGYYFAERIKNIDHWIAFILLGFIGGKMLYNSFSEILGKDKLSKEEEKINSNPFQFLNMLLLAIATSIDALAIGITFAFLHINIFTAILIIGITTFVVSFIGVKIGSILGCRFKSRAEIIGGFILVIIGFRILIEHLFF